MPEALHYSPYLIEWETIIAQSWKTGVVILIGIILCLSILYAALRKKRRAYTSQITARNRLYKGRDYVVCMGLFVLSLIVNLAQIERDSLSSMEGTYLTEAAQNTNLAAAITNRDGITNSHMPLYRTLLYLWMKTGQSVAHVRVLSAVLGALASSALYVFALNFLARPLAVVSVVLLLISPIHIYFSQSIMPYALLSFCVYGYYAAFLRCMENPRGSATCFYVTFLALGLNTHAIFLGLLVPPFIAVLLSLRHDATRKPEAMFTLYLYLEKTLLGFFFLLPFAAMHLAYLKFFTDVFPTMIGYLEAIPHISELSWRGRVFFLHVLSLISGVFPAHSIAALSTLGVLLICTVTLVLARQKQALLCCVMPLALLVAEQFLAFTYLSQAFFEVRYFCCAPGFYWLTCLIVLELCRKRLGQSDLLHPIIRRRQLALGSIAVSLMLTLPSLVTLYQRPRHTLQPDLASLAGFLRASQRPGDALCVTPAPFFADILLYYLSGPWPTLYGWTREVASLQFNAFPPDTSESTTPALITNCYLPWEEASRNMFFERIWLVYSDEHTLGYPEYSDAPYRRVQAYYERTCVREGSWSFPYVQVTCYRPRFRIQGWEDRSFVLVLGRDDYPYLKGLAPPITIANPYRSVCGEAGIRLPLYRSLKDPWVVMYVARESCANDGGVLRIACSVGSSRTHQSYRLGDLPIEAEHRIEITCPADKGPWVELTFSVETESLRDKGTCACPVRLYRIEFEDRQ